MTCPSLAEINYEYCCKFLLRGSLKNLLLIIPIVDSVLGRNTLHSIKHAFISKQEACIVWKLSASSFARVHTRI